MKEFYFWSTNGKGSFTKEGIYKNNTGYIKLRNIIDDIGLARYLSINGHEIYYFKLTGEDVEVYELYGSMNILVTRKGYKLEKQDFNIVWRNC